MNFTKRIHPFRHIKTFLLLALFGQSFTAQAYDVTVAKDGSGN